MADKKVKVYNRSGSSFGLVTASGLPRNIKPGAFEILTEDDVHYISSTSDAFRKHYLFLEEDDYDVLEDVGITPEENHYYSDEEIVKILRGNRKEFDEFIERFDVSDIQMRNRIVDLARNTEDFANVRAAYIEKAYHIDLNDDDLGE